MADGASTHDEEARSGLRDLPLQRGEPHVPPRVETDRLEVVRRPDPARPDPARPDPAQPAPAPDAPAAPAAARARRWLFLHEELGRIGVLLRFIVGGLVDGFFFVAFYGLHVLLKQTMDRAQAAWGPLDALNDVLFDVLLFISDMLTLGVVIVFFVRDAVTAARRIWKGTP